MTDQDDIEACLTTFERIMMAFELARERWTYMLVPQLTGKAQKTFVAMDVDAVGNYDDLKKVILCRYNINEEAYRQHFHTAEKHSDKTYRELVVRMLDLARKWNRECTTKEDVLEALTTEQLLNVLPEKMHVWLRERKPRTCAEAGELADDYVPYGREIRSL